MGAILLCNNNKNIVVEKALLLFKEKGFSDPVCYECGQWHVYAMPKIIGVYENHLSYQGNVIVSVGTPVYKKLDYHDSLHQLLIDYSNDELQLEELYGQYTIVFCRGEKVSILTDPMQTKHLFVDSGKGIISSSFLAVVCALGGKVHINKSAVYEKLLTGFIMRPNTIIEEVEQISSEEWGNHENSETGISFISNEVSLIAEEKKKKDREQCIQEQRQTLLNYFGKLYEYSTNGIDIGISGGYDSRLALACMNKCFHDQLHLHTHSTENVHKKEVSVALEMAECVEKACHIVPTRRLIHCENIDEILRESVLYFDGRTSFAIGGCGEVYTLSYRKESTENTPMTVTGVGGELYRNLFNTGYGKVRIDSFLRGQVFSKDFYKAVDKNVYSRISNDIIKRVSKRLGIEEQENSTKVIVHRYYSEVMMPDGQGNAIDAYNQFSCCVAPFLEPSVISKGYESIPYHGNGGDFEGEIIDSINHDLASIDSAYGYPLNHRPISTKAKEMLRCITPNHIWDQIGELKEGIKSKESRNENDLDILCRKSSVLNDAMNRMISCFPEINFSCLTYHDEGQKRVVFLAMTLDYLAERIEMDE